MFSRTELVEISETFPKHEKQEFLSYIWANVFSQWDAKATTEEATKRASEQQQLAEVIWNQNQ